MSPGGATACLAATAMLLALPLGSARAGDGSASAPLLDPARRQESAALSRDASAVGGLTTRVFHPGVPGRFELLPYDLLRVPELAVRLALTPALPLTFWAEQVALDARVIDVLTNDAKTSLLLPTATAFGSDSFGFGARYTHEDLGGHEAKLLVSASVKSNADRAFEARYAQPIEVSADPWFELSLTHGYDHNERYYGPLGASAARALLVDDTRGELLLALGAPELAGAVLTVSSRLAYRRRREAPGHDPALAPVGGGTAPPGFEVLHHYAELTETLSYDSRDALGATGAGALLELDVRGVKDVSGAPLGAFGGAARATVFIGLAPRGRVLVLHAGAAAVSPWSAGEDVPLHTLVSLGRATFLRGYAERRFRDRTGWWGSFEYRYPIFEYGDAALASTFFVDIGQVAPSYTALDEAALRYSYGFGVRAATLAAFVLRLQLGFSPEGSQLTLSLNEAYVGS